MTKTRRRFNLEDKQSILQEAEREGVVQTCRKHNLAQSVLRYWRAKYLVNGKEGLKGSFRRFDPHLRELEEENERLKRIIAKQAIELEFKTELIKKNQTRLHNAKR